jgi:hypothetical protein
MAEGTLKEKDEKLQRRALKMSIVKTYVEVIGFSIAGLWAIYIFKLKDAPNLNKAFKITNTIKVDAFAKNPDATKDDLLDDVSLAYKLDVKNVGITDLYVDSVFIKVWQLPTDSISLDKFIDFSEISIGEKFNPITSMYFEDSGLNGYYPPDTESGDVFDFKVPLSYDKAILVTHRIFGHGKSGVFGNKNIELTGQAWKLQCVPDKKEEK